MRRFFLTAVTAVFVLSQTITTQADIIPLMVDSTQSSIAISLNGNTPDTSPVSGTGTLDVSSIIVPFGSAQLTDLDLVLDNGLSLNPGIAGVFGVTTQPGDVIVSLDTPGPAGIVSGGTFDQLGNGLSLGGDVTAQTLLGPQVVDLSTLAPAASDFTNVQISQSGNIFTIAATFQINDTINAGGLLIPFQADGVIFASGEVAAVPEPAAAILLLGVCLWLPTRRIR